MNKKTHSLCLNPHSNSLANNRLPTFVQKSCLKAFLITLLLIDPALDNCLFTPVKKLLFFKLLLSYRNNAMLIFDDYWHVLVIINFAYPKLSTTLSTRASPERRDTNWNSDHWYTISLKASFTFIMASRYLSLFLFLVQFCCQGIVSCCIVWEMVCFKNIYMLTLFNCCEGTVLGIQFLSTPGWKSQAKDFCFPSLVTNSFIYQPAFKEPREFCLNKLKSLG